MNENTWHAFLMGIVFGILVLAIIKVSLYGWDATYCG